ncbi:hypothetical protein KPL70_014281 [Citrus sinensis]|nr:hypothetical protein KPL70_014281 [Citrus sinensis]
MCNPDCPCLDDRDVDDELVMRRKKKKKKKSSYPQPSCKSFPPQPPLDPKPPVHPIRSCLMFSSQSYEESFPPLEKQTDTQTRVISKPFVQSPVTAYGQPEEPKQYETVLNWETKNASAQNQTLQQLDRISKLEVDLRRMINNHIWGPEFTRKEAEIRKLKAELTRIDAEKTRPSLFTQTQTPTVPPPIFETYAPFYTPSRPQQPVYNQFFGFSHLQPTPQPKPSSPRKSKSKVKISEPKPKATSSSSTSSVPSEDSPKATPEPPKKDKGPMDQYHYHIVQNTSSDCSELETVYESNPSESNPSSSSSSTNSVGTSTDFESEYADITSILMATKTEDLSTSTTTPIVEDNSSDAENQTTPIEPEPPMPPPVPDHSTKPSSASWFTFDDIPHHKWPARLQEFTAWIDLQGTKPNVQPQAALRDFMARSTGSLHDWLESLGEYRQLQFMQSPVDTTLNIIHEQFIGERTASTDADKKEYHQMKYCSLKRHLLESHYKRMSILFYKLNGFNEPSLKHVFIASLPSELQHDLQRKLTATNLSIADISLGRIFQMAMLCLDKMCEQKEFFKDLMEDKKSFSEAYKKPYLRIECKDDKKCLCPAKKKRHFQKHFHRKSSSKKPPILQKERCFTSEQDDHTAFIIAESYDSDDISIISTVQTVNHVSAIPKPSLKMSVLPSKFHKPIPVIGFIDTGADTSMIDPSVLSSDHWEKHSKLFRAVNGETFETTLITKKPIVLHHLTTPEFSPDLLWTLLEWYSPLMWWRQQLKNMCTFHELDKMLEQEADMFTTVFIVHRPYFQHPEIRDFWTQDMAYEWKTYPHPYTLIHDPSVTSVLKSYLMELNNVQPPSTNIHHTSVGPSHTLEIVPRTQTCTPGSSSSPRGILVIEQRRDYTNVLFQDAQDPWKYFKSPLHTENSHYTVTDPDPLAPSVLKEMTTTDEEAYLQAEAYLDQRQIRRAKRQYEKATGDVSPSRYPSTL